MEIYPDGRFLRIGSCSAWISSALDRDPNLHRLVDLDLLLSRPECEIVKDERKTKVGRIWLEVGGRLTRIYLKRYNVFSWLHRFASLVMTSRASRSWSGAGILLGAGFHTGRPIAAVEHRSWGMLTKSFYLSEEIPSGKTADAYWREELLPFKTPNGFRRRRKFLAALAHLFRALHDSHVYHNDLKDANIVVCAKKKGEEEFFLLDLDGIRGYRRLSRRRRTKNLVQLNRTMGKFLRQTEKLYFLKVYLGPAFFDPREKRRWVRSMLEQSERFERRSLMKTASHDGATEARHAF